MHSDAERGDHKPIGNICFVLVLDLHAFFPRVDRSVEVEASVDDR